MCRFKILIWLFLSLLFTSFAGGQDIHFSQFWETPLVVNPALAGVNKQPVASLAYRNQWRSIGTPYSTFMAMTDAPLTAMTKTSGFLAAGISIFNDKAGESEMGQFQTSISLAYHVNINEYNTLAAAINGGYAQRSINYSNLKWGSQFDGYSFNSSLPSGQSSGSDQKGFFDVGSGIVWNYAEGEKYMSGNDHVKASIGFSVFHLNRPNYSFTNTIDKLNIKSVLFGDFQFGVANSNLSVLPRFYYARQGVMSELLFGSSFMYVLEERSNYTGFQKGKAISAGIYLRTRDAIITTVQLDIASFALGLSYDFNVSSLKEATGGRGGMELTLGYLFNKKAKRA
jgi:type IX secretion system PorP/SprF family membrane protein